jgi:putative ABC transport system permease protein
MGGAWYVGRVRWRQLWRQSLLLAIVAGITGGAVLGAAAGARRSLSAYDRLLRVSRSPHEVLSVLDNAPAIERWLKASAMVDHVATGAGMIGREQRSEAWYSLYAPFDRQTFGVGAAIVRGRLPSPGRADEVFITLRTSRNTGLDVGDQVSFRAYGRTQTARVVSNPWTAPTGDQVTVRIVGVARDPSDAQRSQTIKLLFGTPAFARAHTTTATFTPVFVWLKGGPGAEVSFESQLAPVVQRLPNSVLNSVASRADAQASEQSSRPVAIGLLIFAAVVALAGLIVIVQALRRGLALRGPDDGHVLAALGATRADRGTAQVLTAMPYIGLATVIAIVTCYVSSPIFPIGATRALEPSPGLRVDAFVLSVGGVAWFLVLFTATAFAAWGDAASTTRLRTARPRKLANPRAEGGVLPAAIGVSFALGPGTMRSARRRVAFAGIIVAITGVVGSIVFVGSLDAFTSTPTRFGIAFDLSLELPSGHARTVLTQLAGDQDLAAVVESRSGTVTLDGRTIVGYSLDPRKSAIPATAPAGRLPQRNDEIAIGPKLLTALHKQIGDNVDLSTSDGTRNLRIVGTVLSPVSESNAFNQEALLTSQTLDVATPRPAIAALLRLRPGANLSAVTAQLHSRYPFGVTDESPAHAPGPVRNLQQVAQLPLVLALFFAVLGVAALAQAILLTTSERRRDIAVLRSLGFTRRQVVSVLLAATTSVATAGILVGIPVGIVAGTLGWRAVADALYITPTVSVPMAGIAAISFGLLGYAVLIGVVPGRLAVSRAPAASLHTE